MHKNNLIGADDLWHIFNRMITQVSHPQWGTVPHLVTLCLMRLSFKYQVRNLSDTLEVTFKSASRVCVHLFPGISKNKI